MHYDSFFFGAAFLGAAFLGAGFGAFVPSGIGMSGTLLLPPPRPLKKFKKPFNELFILFSYIPIIV
jgi:hypothetical protein